MVGCGYTYYDDPKRGFSKLYVCNYGPGGNLVGGSMYTMGFPGMTNCHQRDLAPSSRFVGLCGKEIMMKYCLFNLHFLFNISEVSTEKYHGHLCDNVFPPSMTEMPPDLHKPTPAPPKSIFHEMMVGIGRSVVVSSHEEIIIISSSFLFYGH